MLSVLTIVPARSFEMKTKRPQVPGMTFLRVVEGSDPHQDVVLDLDVVSTASIQPSGQFEGPPPGCPSAETDDTISRTLLPVEHNDARDDSSGWDRSVIDWGIRERLRE